MEKVKRLIDICFKKNITPLIWGNHGIGKSQVIRDLAKEKDMQLVDIRLGQLEPMDLLGLPEKTKDTTTWLRPTWFPKSGKGILFLDEINRGHPDVMQAIFQLVLDRKLHTHELPEGWKVICAANYNTENYSVNEMDEALMDRFFHINLIFDKQSWFTWANKNNIQEGLIKAVEQNLIKSDENILNLTTTPRSIEMLNAMLENAQEDLYFDICKGLVNHKDISIILKSLGILKEEYDILNSFDSNTKSKIKKLIKKKELDKIHNINKVLLSTLKITDGLSKAQLGNLTNYLGVIPKDVTIGFMKNFMKNPLFDQYINTDEFISLKKKLSTKNQEQIYEDDKEEYY